jgi:twitching motility protein PilT
MSTMVREPTEQEKLFGRIAVEQGHVSPEQLVEAVRIQSREGWSRKLGEIFLDSGWIDSGKLLLILEQQRRVAAQPASPASGHGTAPAPAAPPRAGGPVAMPAPAATRAPAAIQPPVGTLKLRSTVAATPAVASGAPVTACLGAGASTELEALLRQVIAAGASDLHLHSGSRPRVRVDGVLRDLSSTATPADQVAAMARAVLPPPLLARLERQGEVDFVHDLPGLGRFRGNAYRQQRGTDLVLRAIPAEPPTLASLGLPGELSRLTHHHQGLVLVTGPSGCGKTSTMAALVRLINEERQVHILTAEEPIEFRQPSRRALVNQREIGTHSDSYARVLRGALREDPDVIALGDLRDHASISLALTAAETGHLVMATMHTSGALRTINRLIGAFPPNEQDQVRIMVSESLRAIVSQRLVPRKDGRGRVVALELLIATRAVSNLIRERKTFQIESVLQLGAGDGMCTMEQSLDRLVAAGVVAASEAMRHRGESYLVADDVEAAGHAAS